MPETNPAPGHSHTYTSTGEDGRDVTAGFPCGTCDKSVSSFDRGVACEGCGQWFHAPCQSIGNSTYSRLGDSDVIWRCLICDCANYSCTAFDLHDVSRSSLTLSLDATLSSPTASSLKPLHSSTPTRQDRRHSNKQLARPLRFLNVNARSCIKNLPGLLNLIDTTKPDIIFVTETRLAPDIKDAEILPPNYKAYRCDRNRFGGGCLIAIASHLSHQPVPELSVQGCELVFAKIKLNGTKDIIVGTYYKPDDGDVASLELFETAMKRIRPMSAYIVVGGDFNFPSFDWSTNSLKSPCVHQSLHLRFLDFLYDHNLHQMVTFPTRDNNTLDLFVTDHPTLVPRVEPVPGISDHLAVFMEFQVQPERRNVTNRQVPCYRRANWTAMHSEANDLASKIKNSFTPKDNVENIWACFKDGLKEIIKQHVPHITPKAKYGKPWVDAKSKGLIRKRDRAFKRWKKSRDPDHLAELKLLKRQVQRQLRRNYWTFTSNMFEDNEDSGGADKKKFWAYVKSQKTESTNVSPLKVNGQLITDPKAQAETLNQQFRSVFSEHLPCSPEDFQKKTGLSLDTGGPTCSSIKVEEKGVRKLLKNLKTKKAPGPDGISPRFLKELADEIAPILTLIFQSSLDSGVVPLDWRTASVAPIFKKGERYRPENYRPISLTSVPGKILEHIIVHNIMNFVEQNNILCKEQHGFRKQRSCISQLIGLMDDITNCRDRGKQVDMVVMDFAKAFDKVSHSLLCYKLQHYGIQGDINRWIRSFLADRRQAVVVDGTSSSYVAVESGVPQGSVLGPCLFLLFINDLPNGLSSTARLFADDTACHKEITSSADQIQLQHDLDNLATWEQKWQMAFHPEKCEVLHFGSKYKKTYMLRDHPLKCRSESKYLGVTISTDLSWKKHTQNVSSKANKTLGFLRRNVKTDSINIKECAYKTFVRPQLEYAAAVWDPYRASDKSLIDKVQRRAARWVVNDYRSTSSVTKIHQKLGWDTLEERRKSSRLSTLLAYHHGNLTINSNSLPQSQLPRHNTRRSHPQRYLIETWHRDYRKFSFFPWTIIDFNSLPQEVISASVVSH